MHTHLTSRLGRWRRLVQYWDTAAAAWQAQVACGWINLLERLPLRESGRQSNKPHAVQLELDPLEARFFPGQTAGVAGALGWSLTEAGLARVDQAVVRSTEPAPLRHSARLWSHADSVGAGDLLAFSRPNIFWSPETARLPSTDSTVAAHQVSLQGAPDTGRTIAPDPLADPFVDVLTGESMRPKPPPRAAGDGMPDRHHGADGGGGGGGRSSSAGAVGNDANVSRPLSPATTFNLDGSPITGAGPSKTTIQPAPLNGHSNGGSAAPGKGHKSAAGADPLWVLDMNKGLVLTPGVPGHEFSNWSMDLQAQVSGATVSSYSWDLTQASDATGVTGASTFELKFTWASFTGAPHTDTISVTETPTVGSPITQSYTFEVISTSSAAYTATAPTSSATWATVLAPDQLRTEETAGQSPYFQLGLATGELQTSHQLPSYNPNVPALQLEYSSAMADPKPVFIVHYQLDPAQSSVPSWVSAQLSAFPNHSANQVYYYNTSSLNPGDIMEIALQGDASGLTAGSEYAYTITVKANYATQTTNTYTGTYHAVNSSGAFGPGWSIAGLQQLWAPADGAIVQEGSGQGLFFGAPPSTAFGDGHYVSPPGDFTNLVGKVDGTGYRTYPDGRQINFSTTGLQTSVVDPNNNTTGYSYNGQQLTAITDLNNQLVTFSYNGSGQVTSIRDPANRLTTFAYDGSGRLQSIRDADGALWTYAYDGISNRIASVTDPRGNITSVAYNFAGRVATVTRPDNTTEQLSAVQMQGLVQAGQGTQGSPATPVLVAQAQSQYTDPRGNVWQTSLDWLGFGARTALTAPLAGATVVTLNYRDANGLAWMTSDPLGHRYRRFFDASGNPTTVVQPDGSSWQYVYNSFSEVTQATDPLGDMTTFSYDANGNLIKRKDALNNVTTYTNTTQGLRATEQDARGNTTSYAYDSLNRLTTVTNALGGLATTAYDSAGRVIRSTDALGHGTSYAYDAMNRVTAVTDALGKTTTSLYDPAGNLQAKIDPLNHQVSYAYDSLNRLIQTTDPLGGIATVIYDEAGNVKARIDALGHRVSYAYDGLNRQTQITDALSHTTTTAYDLAGNVTSVTDARGNTTATSYDALNRVVTVTDPLNHTVTTVYDAAGNVTRTIDALNNATTMGYDALNRLITIQDPTGGVATTLCHQYQGPCQQPDVLRLRCRQPLDPADRPLQPQQHVRVR